MKFTTVKSLLLAGVASLALMTSLPAGKANAAGLMTPRGSGLPKLELRDHDVKVVVEDGYAITTIDQRFSNPNGQDLEAVYSFPVPEKAAVSEFTYWIDGKPVTGEIVEKDRARTGSTQTKSRPAAKSVLPNRTTTNPSTCVSGRCAPMAMYRSVCPTSSRPNSIPALAVSSIHSRKVVSMSKSSRFGQRMTKSPAASALICI